MKTDTSFLEFSEDDTADMRNLKSHWQTVMALSPAQRLIFLQEQRVQDEEQHLQFMIEYNQSVDEFVDKLAKLARHYVAGFEVFNDESALSLAELLANAAQDSKEVRYSISDIRNQREKIQWQKKLLSQMQTEQPKHEQAQS